MWGAIGEIILEFVGHWLGWRFWIPVGAAILVGVLALPHVADGAPSKIVGGVLLVLGLGGGIWWEAKAS